MSKIAIELKLSDEDRDAIISAVEAKLKSVAEAAAKNAGKGATTGKGKSKPAAAAAESTDDDGFEDTDGEADADADESGDADADNFDGEEETAAATKNDVQAALRDYAAVTSKAEAMKLLEKHGKCKGLSALEDKNFAAVIKAANDATAKKKKAK